jgi:hypothetical protein
MISRHFSAASSASVIAATLSMGLAFQPPPAEAQGPFIPGEQQPVVDMKRRPLAIYAPGEGQVLAQTFTAPTDQWLGYLNLPVGCAEGVSLSVKIRLGIGGVVLSEGIAARLPAVVDGTFVTLQVHNRAIAPRGIRLKRGRTYAFELTVLPGSGGTRTCGIARGPALDSYARGTGYYQDPINGPDFLDMGEDLPFVTLVE